MISQRVEDCDREQYKGKKNSEISEPIKTPEITESCHI